MVSLVYEGIGWRFLDASVISSEVLSRLCSRSSCLAIVEECSELVQADLSMCLYYATRHIGIYGVAQSSFRVMDRQDDFWARH